MRITSYKEETTRGADPTQIETWKGFTQEGRPFTVTQFFGDYLVDIPGTARFEAPKDMVRKLQAYADRSSR